MSRLRPVASTLLACTLAPTIFSLTGGHASASPVPVPLVPPLAGSFSGSMDGVLGVARLSMDTLASLSSGVVAAGSMAGSTGASSYADTDEALGYAGPRRAFAAFNKAPPLQPAFVPSWMVSATGFGGSLTNSGNGGASDATSRIYGALVAATYRTTPDTLWGFALTGGGSNYSVANGDSGSADLFQASIYARQNFGATYLLGLFSYGWQDNKADRTSGVDRLHAEYNTNSYTGRIETGHRFAVDGTGLTPYAAAQIVAIDLPSYSETGAGLSALSYNSQTVTDTRSELGLRADKSFAVTDGIVTLSGRAAWAHDYNPSSAVTGTFLSLPTTTMVVNSVLAAPDSALVTAAVQASFRNGWSVAASFEGEYSNVVTSNAGRGTLRYDW